MKQSCFSFSEAGCCSVTAFLFLSARQKHVNIYLRHSRFLAQKRGWTHVCSAWVINGVVFLCNTGFFPPSFYRTLVHSVNLCTASSLPFLLALCSASSLEIKWCHVIPALKVEFECRQKWLHAPRPHWRISSRLNTGDHYRKARKKQTHQRSVPTQRTRSWLTGSFESHFWLPISSFSWCRNVSKPPLCLLPSGPIKTLICVVKLLMPPLLWLHGEQLIKRLDLRSLV